MAEAIMNIPAFPGQQATLFPRDRTVDDLLEDNNKWLAESTAAWMEDAVYPLVNDYEQYVNHWVDSPEESLFSSDSYHQYGAVLFQKYLTENYRPPSDPDGGQVIRTIWQPFPSASENIVTLNVFSLV